MCLLIASISITSVTMLSLTVNKQQTVYRPLPRFWTNTGFSPPAPLPLNNTQIIDELLDDDVHMSLDLIASLPNHAISHIRIHWLLSMIKVM